MTTQLLQVSWLSPAMSFMPWLNSTLPTAWLPMATARRAIILIRSVHICFIPYKQPVPSNSRLGSDKPLALGAHLQKLLAFDVEPPPVVGVKDRAPQDPEDDVRPEIVTVIELFDRVHDVPPAQPRILKHGKLMSLLVRHHRIDGIVVFLQVGIELRARIRMRHRNLNRLRIELHGKLNGPLDRRRRFPWRADLEIAVHHKAQLLAIFHDLARLFDRGAFLDVLQNLRIAGLEPDDQQPAASLFHRLQGLVARRHPGVAGPGKLQRLESLADLDRAVLGPGKRVIVEENFLRLGEGLQAALDLLDAIANAACP